MIQPSVLTPRPSYLMGLVAGLVASLLLSSMIFIAPLFGFPFIDFPLLIGGVLTEDPVAAFWLGFWIFFLIGWLVFPPLLILLWPRLPGRNVGFIGALIKGLIWGLVLFVFSGLTLPLFGALNQVAGVENPGFFGLNRGVLAAVGILLGHLAYGVALGLVTAMPQGVGIQELLGWRGLEHADLRPFILEREGRDVP